MSPQPQIRILSVDDHPLYREGIAAVIKEQHDMLLVAEAATAAEATECYREHRPDVTLMDVKLPDSTGIAVVCAIRKEHPEARIILVSTFDDVEMRDALQAGASGYILKTLHPRDIANMIRQVHLGHKCVPPSNTARSSAQPAQNGLTSNDLNFLTQVARGRLGGGATARYIVSEDSVKRHLRRISPRVDAQGLPRALSTASRRDLL